MNEGVPSRRQVLRATIALGAAAAAFPALAGPARADTAGTGTGGTDPGSGHVALDAVANHIAAGVRRPRIPRRRFSNADFGAVAAGAQLDMRWPTNFNAMVYVLSGRGTVGREGRPIEEGQLADLGYGEAITLRAADTQPQAAANAMDVLILGGRPIREPVARYGPFVMNTKEEIHQAMADFQAGRLATVQPQHLAHRSEADTDL